MDDLFAEIISDDNSALNDQLQNLGHDARARVNKLADISPLYARHLKQNPADILWLETPHNRDVFFRKGAFSYIWEEEYRPEKRDKALYAKALRRFRRKMSLRIAYREINGLAQVETTLSELSTLADFCLREMCDLCFEYWETRIGTPWYDQGNRPARYAVLGLGKLGAEELNFNSDIDLIFFYEGRGNCHKDGKETGRANEELFSKVARETSQALNERESDLFVFNIDLRLRPEGQSGPLVRTLSSMENYYFAAGQTWERLALIRGRTVAGDLELGGEFFESINSFRYPRHPSLSLLSEVAGVKLRIEKELLGEDNLKLNIKTGYGGIREVEFFVQGQQLIHGGKNPFLQTPKTLEALTKLTRYQLITPRQEIVLREAYLFLRLVENRLQMREEKQTHSLPENPEEMETLARSLNFENAKAFLEKLESVRQQVRENYNSLYGEFSPEEDIEDWTLLLSGNDPSPAIQESINRWFIVGAKDAPEVFRVFVRGGPHNLLTREQVILFRELTRQFDDVLPPLAHPQRTLSRVATFATRYGARMQFLKTCRDNPHFFRILCFLFDRSEFIWDLLCKHPEIMEELLALNYRREKSVSDMREEIELLPNGDQFGKWLWLYVKAEQVRIATAELIGSLAPEEVEESLTHLANATLSVILERVDPEGDLTLIALGKFGGSEMAFGSDLDIMFIGSSGSDPELARKVHQFTKLASYKGPLGPTFEIDTRLRPYGNDGPVVTTLTALEKYHESSAQIWEKQLLTRARVVCGNHEHARAFEAFRQTLLYSKPATKEEIEEINRMRHRIETEKVKCQPVERAFKAGPGGLIDIEFLCQSIQLKHGHAYEELRDTNTRDVLRAAAHADLLDRDEYEQLAASYDFLRLVELYLRRENNSGITELSTNPDQEHSIAKWLGFRDFHEFLGKLTSHMRGVRVIYNKHNLPNAS